MGNHNHHPHDPHETAPHEIARCRGDALGFATRPSISPELA